MSKNQSTPAPSPLACKDQPVNWLFIFKFNAENFPGGGLPAGTPGIFGGTHKDYKGRYSQQYVFATNKNPTLQKGTGALGATSDDPLGATFAQIYNGDYYYVLWNDQFYNAPIKTKGSPWGHAKGMLAWNDAGEGMVLQVSTPSWPGSGSKNHPRQGDGNTLGTIKDDDIEVSQHFFGLKLSKADVVLVLQALQKASVVTDTSQPEIVNNGGPQDIQDLVSKLGTRSRSKIPSIVTLSSGVRLISKPSGLAVPPWQMISSKLGGLPLRVASWWAHPAIPSTTGDSKVTCWSKSLIHPPGAVDIAITGKWDGVTLSLRGAHGENSNHAKLGVSTDSEQPISIFGDQNQQGAIRKGYVKANQKCSSSQNGRGGTFYVLHHQDFFDSLTALLKGDSAPLEDPSKGQQ